MQEQAAIKKAHQFRTTTLLAAAFMAWNVRMHISHHFSMAESPLRTGLEDSDARGCQKRSRLENGLNQMASYGALQAEKRMKMQQLLDAAAEGRLKARQAVIQPFVECFVSKIKIKSSRKSREQQLQQESCLTAASEALGAIPINAITSNYRARNQRGGCMGATSTHVYCITPEATKGHRAIQKTTTAACSTFQ